MTSEIILDLDNTLTMEQKSCPYPEKAVRETIMTAAKSAQRFGYRLRVCTARNMRSFEGDLEKIQRHTLPIARAWLAKHDLNVDEVLGGKPWAGPRGFYVDDRAMHLEEFAWRFTGPFQHISVSVQSIDSTHHEILTRAERWLHVVSYTYPGSPDLEDPLVGPRKGDWDLWVEPGFEWGVDALLTVASHLIKTPQPLVLLASHRPVCVLAPKGANTLMEAYQPLPSTVFTMSLPESPSC